MTMHKNIEIGPAKLKHLEKYFDLFVQELPSSDMLRKMLPHRRN